MTYYQVLGLSSNASEMCIKHAFRCRAKLLHPDVNPGIQAKQEFQLVNEAYQVLRNPEKRRLYDLRVARQRIITKRYYKSHYPQFFWNTQGCYNQPDSQTKHNQSWFEKIFDHFLFLSMLFLGLSALFFGVLRAIERPVDGVNPYLGIIFGVLFTSLFLFGWDKMHRIKS